MADTFAMPSLKAVEQSLVDDSVALLKDRLTEYVPSVDFSKQASFTLVPYLHGLLLAGTTQELVNTLQSATLKSVLAGTASDAQSDQVAAQFGITRKPAVKAHLSVMIVLSNQVPFGISVNDSFSFGAIQVAVETSVNVRASASTVTSVNDYVLTRIGTGKWGVVIPVAAKVEGASGNLAPGTLLVASKSITSFVKAYVLTANGDGIDQESNASMASRILAAESIDTWAGRTSFEAIARRDSQFSSLVAMSVIGFGDTEQRRDKRGVLPVACGGRTDLWTKFRPGLYSASVAVTAVLSAKTGTVGTWSFTLNGTDNPAVYRVGLIVAADDQSGQAFIPVSEVNSLGVPAGMVVPRGSATTYVPDVKSSLEAAYSSYSNTTVLFDDEQFDVTSATIGTSRDYVATVYYEPLVEILQQKLGALSASNPAGDILVKTAIPCELSITVTVSLYQGKTAPSTAVVQQAIIEFIGTSGFVGSISKSDITATAVAAVAGAGTVNVTAMVGRLKKPDSTYLSIDSSTGEVTIPSLPEDMVTPNTVAFYTDAAKVSVVLQ